MNDHSRDIDVTLETLHHEENRQTCGNVFIDTNHISLCDVKESYPNYDLLTFKSKASLNPVKIDRIKISSLDSIGKRCFKDIKELNLIQSIVFDTAYNTNENLLIAAPTGAGKTNIAVLTILHEIRNNINVEGNIIFNNFKIIYIAPMKALASEMTANFSKKLKILKIRVKECTGDMQLTKQEIRETQLIVTTPEKYDVITRKGTGEKSLVNNVRLVIIDEVHVLHEDRGSVIEAIVARTLRQCKTNKRTIRIVGLSATLPNYIDVASFLNVNLNKGLFYFDGRFRSVPLQQTVIGVKGNTRKIVEKQMDYVCYEKMIESVEIGKQVMVFVNSRSLTWETANCLKSQVMENDDLEYFLCNRTHDFETCRNVSENSKDKNLGELFNSGFGIHHAGMVRKDRNFIEEQFLVGNIKVLCCTTTLAWGVNLPAHIVIIKGTDLYDPEKGQYVDLGILDILQIFGRAGRPQFDDFGHGILITKDRKMDEYISLLRNQQEIESRMETCLHEHLNAEIALGTVSTVLEAIDWLGYSFLYVRMLKNPTFYGADPDKLTDDPERYELRKKSVVSTLKTLHDSKLITFDEVTERIVSTYVGQLSSTFYIKFSTAKLVQDVLKQDFGIEEILSLLTKTSEYSNITVRHEEVEELSRLKSSIKYPCLNHMKSPKELKINTLIQCHIDRCNLEESSLCSDLYLIAQSLPRLTRYLFELTLKNNWASLSRTLLNLLKMIDLQLWDHYCPLWQFQEEFYDQKALQIIDQHKLSINDCKEKSVAELRELLKDFNDAFIVKNLVYSFPLVFASVTARKIEGSMLKLNIYIQPDFVWLQRYHGTTFQSFLLTVEDCKNDIIYYYEYVYLSLYLVSKNISFTIPTSKDTVLRIVSDRWIGPEYEYLITVTKGIKVKNKTFKRI